MQKILHLASFIFLSFLASLQLNAVAKANINLNVSQYEIPAGDTTLFLKKRIVSASPEKSFRNEHQSLGSNFDFSLQPTTKGSFSLKFTHYGDTKVRIYDIIGNVILEEEISAHGKFSKEYDLSASKSGMFIVEVGNARYNKTKSVVSG